MSIERIEALEEYFYVWKQMEKQFLQTLLARIIKDVPDFKAELFVTNLQLLQEALPISDDDTAEAGQLRIALKFLGELTEVAENAIASAT
jgi:hypothetical protein